MNKLHCLSTVTVVLLALLTKLESDPGKFSIAQSAILNADYRDLFQFVAHPDTVEVWFRWISHFRAADKRPLGVGKLYQAVYSLPVLGDYIMLFRVMKYVPDSCMVLESESWLKPRFEVFATPISEEQARLTFRLVFRRSSALFQYTLGPLLRIFAQHYIQNSFSLLSNV
ncbi:uncharacterized protein [Anabrus simplex]|uniref:uncharacterized protein n=1 Tax=Anabrus simplex TaxID=316456 RepID=UPI0035A3AF69